MMHHEITFIGTQKYLPTKIPIICAVKRVLVKTNFETVQTLTLFLFHVLTFGI